MSLQKHKVQIDNALSLFPIFLSVNLMAIAILSGGRCGLSRCTTKYLVSMAVADLLVIITAVILNRLPAIYLSGSFLSITPVCSLCVVLIYASMHSSVWLTVAFTLDRFVAICCQELKAKYCTERTAVVVITTVCVLAGLQTVPWYFVYGPIFVINGVPWYCRVKGIYSTSSFWRAFDWLDRILTPCVPFLLIFLLNVLTVRYILAASKARSRLRAQNNGEKQSDPEMENRRKSIILLFTISASFILLWTTDLVQFFHERITNIVPYGFSDPIFILQESANMLVLLNSCTNTFIYAITQSSFRKELKAAIIHPFIIFGNIYK
ncbi:putative G-protein coupled receptor 139 [Rhinoraja longicauda]